MLTGMDNEKTGESTYTPGPRDKTKNRDCSGSTTTSLLSVPTGQGGGGGGQGHADPGACHGVDKVLNYQEELKMRLNVAGMVEKKTFIGLVSDLIVRGEEMMKLLMMQGSGF